jgi:glycosyltransferase involved in cell wall biosynthesis
MEPPLVSVVITTKNRTTLLPRAVRSVLEQTWPVLELIVVDDGSETPAVLPTSDPRARLIRHDVSKGLCEARNLGFRVAKGRFFCMLDDDDWYLPDKLENQVRYLMENPEIDQINLMAYNVIHPSSVLFRREVFDKVQFEPRIRKYEDTLFFNRLCFTVSTAFLPTDVSVWMQDGRHDQLTRVFFNRNFIAFRLVCEGLRDILQRYPQARRKYYGRLAYQAMRCGRVFASIKAAGSAFGLFVCN